MSRPLRIEFPHALYHLTSRGNRREAIFLDDADCEAFLDVLAQCCERMDAAVYAYCLMGNHYHLVLTTRRPNLSALMRQLNGVYTQRFNRRHGKAGHVFQGRFKAILVDREAYFLEICRYVELNPVRAHLVRSALDWRWSSLRFHAGMAAPPSWLDSVAVLSAMLGRDLKTPVQRRAASRRYLALMESAPDAPIWEGGLLRQVFLGDEGFVERMQAQASPAALRSPAVPRPQRTRVLSLDHWLKTCPTRTQALWHAHVDSGMTITAIAGGLRLSVGRTSQLVRVSRGSDSRPDAMFWM